MYTKSKLRWLDSGSSQYSEGFESVIRENLVVVDHKVTVQRQIYNCIKRTYIRIFMCNFSDISEIYFRSPSDDVKLLNYLINWYKHKWHVFATDVEYVLT